MSTTHSRNSSRAGRQPVLCSQVHCQISNRIEKPFLHITQSTMSSANLSHNQQVMKYGNMVTDRFFADFYCLWEKFKYKSCTINRVGLGRVSAANFTNIKRLLLAFVFFSSKCKLWTSAPEGQWPVKCLLPLGAPVCSSGSGPPATVVAPLQHTPLCKILFTSNRQWTSDYLK